MEVLGGMNTLAEGTVHYLSCWLYTFASTLQLEVESFSEVGSWFARSTDGEFCEHQFLTSSS